MKLPRKPKTPWAAALYQGAVEFAGPLLLAIAYSIWSSPDGPKEWFDTFSLAFLGLAYLFGNLFRILKQNRVESKFSGIEDRIGDVVSKLELVSDRIKATITGGQSIPLLELHIVPGGHVHWLWLTARGEDVVRDLSLRIQYHDSDHGNHTWDLVQIPAAIPGSPSQIMQNLYAYNGTRHASVFLLCSNGSYRQDFVLEHTTDNTEYATRVMQLVADVEIERFTTHSPGFSDPSPWVAFPQKDRPHDADCQTDEPSANA